MNKVDEIYNAKEKVFLILKTEPETRANDGLLFVRVMEMSGIKRTDISEAIINSKKMGIPKMETVRRARQKIQEEHPELKPSKAVQQAREANEVVFTTLMGGHQ